MTRRSAVWVFPAVVVWLATHAQPASACSIVCSRFLPRTDSVVPSNAPALALVSSSDNTGTVALFRIDGGRSERQEITLDNQGEVMVYGQKLTFIRVAGLVDGARYRLEQSDAEKGCDASASEFDVGPEAALPAQLGRVVPTYSKTDEVGTACPTNLPTLQAYTELYLSLEDQVKPWRDLLLYRQIIDGDDNAKLKSGIANDEHRPQGELQLPCDRDADAETERSARYDISMQAQLLGASERLDTARVSVELTCEVELWKRKEQDRVAAALAAVDAGTEVVRDAGAPVATNPEPARGCSASNAPTSRSGGLAGVLGLGLLAALRMRRARRPVRVAERW
jgi:MYXO-CTERM domain-containing protein